MTNLIGSLLPLLEIEETPEFMLYSRDHHKYIELLEKYRKKNRVDRLESEKEHIDQLVTEHIVLLDALESSPTRHKKDVYSLFRRLSKHWYSVLTMSLVGGFMNTIWTGIILNLNTLAFTEISYNGISMAVVGLLSNLLIM